MVIKVGYGAGFIEIDIPDENVGEVIRPWEGEAGGDNSAIITEAISAGEWEDFCKILEGKRVCVLVSDGTRDMPVSEILTGILGDMKGAEFVLFMICTGTHNSQTDENKKLAAEIEQVSKRAGLKDFEIHVHDCEADELISAGKTMRGTEVFYNRKIEESEVFVVLSDVKSHYFAGYSNPVKNFVPGICGYETAEKNHSWALDERSVFGSHPWHPNAQRRGNRLAADQVEGMEMILRGRGVYAFVTISSGRKIQWARFGSARQVSGEAFLEFDRRNVKTTEPVERLIVSPGGAPNDGDLYIAQRALELTKQAVKDGGEVLFVAACENGIGAERTMENFYNSLTRDVDEILGQAGGEYKLFSHKPVRFAQMIKRLRRVWVYSELEDGVVEAIHMQPAKEAQKVVDGWIKADLGVKITVVDGANKVAVLGE